MQGLVSRVMDPNTQTLDPSDAAWALAHVDKTLAGWRSAVDLALLVAQRPYGAVASIEDLVVDLGFARTTVRRAIARLVEARVVIHAPGQGSAPSAFRLDPRINRWIVPWRAGRSSHAISDALVARRQTVPHTRLVGSVRGGPQADIVGAVKGGPRALLVGSLRGSPQANGHGSTQGWPTTPESTDAYGSTQGWPTNGGAASSSSPTGDDGEILPTGDQAAGAEDEELDRLSGLLRRRLGAKFFAGPPLVKLARLRDAHGAQRVQELLAVIPPELQIPAAVRWLAQELAAGDVTPPGDNPDRERTEELRRRIATIDQLLNVEGRDEGERLSLVAERGVCKNELEEIEARHGASEPAQ